ncbi:MAG TPA: hypothetical protein DFS52_02295 [Myxococcales bacterium]|nr:hypothetical protein [Myxococcales bacterium]
MPLYLVRWPRMEASLVNASDEQHLLDILDELASPSECTWREYEGPLWIDVDLNLKVEIEGREASAESISITGTEEFSESTLKLGYPRTSTASEMCDAILEGAFPNTARRIEELRDTAAEEDEDEWVSSADDLKEAVVQDIVDHEVALLDRGVTFDEQLALVPIRFWYFVRRGRGKFERVDARTVRDFTLGKHAIPPEKDGLVRLVQVTVIIEEGEPSSMRVSETGYQLRTGPNGTIIEPHRADAFPEDEAGTASLFAVRRNEAVRWELTDAEIKAVLKAAEKVINTDWSALE